MAPTVTSVLVSKAVSVIRSCCGDDDSPGDIPQRSIGIERHERHPLVVVPRDAADRLEGRGVEDREAVASAGIEMAGPRVQSPDPAIELVGRRLAPRQHRPGGDVPPLVLREVQAFPVPVGGEQFRAGLVQRVTAVHLRDAGQDSGRCRCPSWPSRDHTRTTGGGRRRFARRAGTGRRVVGASRCGPAPRRRLARTPRAGRIPRTTDGWSENLTEFKVGSAVNDVVWCRAPMRTG